MNSQIKAIFRETARTLMVKDRGARKYGASHDLVGNITSALTEAYKMGQEHERNPEAAKDLLRGNDEILAWEEVPPMSRNILNRLTSSYSRRFRHPATFISSSLVGFTDLKSRRHRWMVATQDGLPKGTDSSFTDKGIGPLLRLGLMIPKDGNKEHIVLTEKGDLTCRRYWNRSDHDDPTLPIMSARG